MFQILKVNPEFYQEPEPSSTSGKYYVLGALGVASLIVGMCFLIIYLL